MGCGVVLFVISVVLRSSVAPVPDEEWGEHEIDYRQLAQVGLCCSFSVFKCCLCVMRCCAGTILPVA